MTPDLSTYINTDEGISDFDGSFGFDFDNFKNPNFQANYEVGSVPVVEGFKEGMASPLCSSSNTETMEQQQELCGEYYKLSVLFWRRYFAISRRFNV
jgi:hypothetical protein